MNESQRVSKWYKYWLDVLETYIVYFGEFHGVLTGINYSTSCTSC
jgi:hypothetical protein